MEKTKEKARGILRWSEKYTKTDMVYLASGSFWLFIKQGIQTIISFIVLIILANVLTPLEYGNYKYILSIIAVIGSIGLTGIRTATIQAVSRGLEGSLKANFKHNIYWSFLSIISAVLVGGYYLINGNLIIGISILVAGNLSSFTRSTNLYLAFLNGKSDFKAITFYGTIQALVTSATLVITTFISTNIIVLISVSFLSDAIISYILYKRILSVYRPNNEIDVDALVFGTHMSLTNLINVILNQLDSILVFHFLGSEALAIYTFSITMPMYIAGSLKNVAILAIPKLSRKSNDDISKSFFKKSFNFSFLLMSISLIYIIFSPFIFKIFFPQYIDSVIYSQIFSLILPIIGFGILHGTFFDSKKIVKERYFLTFSSNIIKFILVYFGLTIYGILGLVIARLLSDLIKSMISSIIIIRIFKRDKLTTS